MSDNPQTAILKVPAPLRILCLPLAGALILSLFSAAPSLGGVIPAPWDKLAHLAFYGTVGVLIAAGMRRSPFWLPLLLTCLVGVADELYQSTLPGRVAGLDDLAMDVLAAALATWLVYRFSRA
jgi:VanZ family protein